jgi:osmoprotectant transport system ATP-binding protein
MIAFDGVTKRYPDGTVAVDDLSFAAPTGQITVLVGPSGCGKTTSLRMVNRMIQPTAGTITLDGHDTARMKESDLRRGMGYVIQHAGLFPHRTVLDNIGTVPRLLGWDRRRTEARARELMERVGLPESMAGRYPAQLSGGQQQRVGVARALASDPPVMLMDEPFSAVDPVVREQLQDEFLRLQAELGKTILFVTHDIDEAIKLGDQVAVLRVGGRLAQLADPAYLLAHPVDDFVADFVGADRALKSLSLTRVEEVELIPAPLVRVGEPVEDVRGRIDRGALTPVAGHLLIATEEGRPLDWLSLDRLDRLTQVPASAPGGAEPVIDHVTTLRDALSALFESNSAYGPVVDAGGRCVGLIGTPEISAGFRRAGNIAAAEGSPQAPVDAGAGAANG